MRTGAPFFVIGLTLLSSGCVARVPEAVTTDRLLAIKRGMTYEQVESLIGPPLCIESLEDPRFSEAETREARDLIRVCGLGVTATPTPVPVKMREAAFLTLSYAEPRENPATEPDIYVSLRKGSVRSVYVKNYDLGICCMEGLSTSPFYGAGSRQLLRQLLGR